jgi:hypothetical protein
MLRNKQDTPSNVAMIVDFIVISLVPILFYCSDVRDRSSVARVGVSLL